VEIDADYAAGVWSFAMDTTYTTVTWTSPDGTETIADITNWLYDGSEYTGQFVESGPNNAKTVHAVRMFVATGGALGRNAYLAISPDTTAMAWNQGVTSSHNGTEFALIACEYDASGNSVSGLYDPITCAV